MKYVTKSKMGGIIQALNYVIEVGSPCWVRGCGEPESVGCGVKCSCWVRGCAEPESVSCGVKYQDPYDYVVCGNNRGHRL